MSLNILTQDHKFLGNVEFNTVSISAFTSPELTSVYTTVNTNSAGWGTGSSVNLSEVAAASANWNSVYTNVKTYSAGWGTGSGTLTSERLDSVYTDVNTYSANWNSVYTNVNLTSASRDSVYTDVNTYSANWNSAFTNTNYTSARNIQPFIFTSNNINLTGANNTYNLFTVPVNYRFSVDFLQILVIDTPSSGTAFSLQLQRASDGQSIIGTLPVPSSAGKYDIFSVANNNSTPTRRFTVDSNQSVRLSGSSTYTTLSCVALIKGSLIPTSLFV